METEQTVSMSIDEMIKRVYAAYREGMPRMSDKMVA